MKDNQDLLIYYFRPRDKDKATGTKQHYVRSGDWFYNKLNLWKK